MSDERQGTIVVDEAIEDRPSTYRCALSQETTMHWRWKVEKWIEGAAYVLLCEGNAPSSEDAKAAIEYHIEEDKKADYEDTTEIWGVD